MNQIPISNFEKWKNLLFVPGIILLLGFIWGSSFILMKRGLLGFPSDQIAAMRLSFAFLAILPFHYIYRKHYRNIPWRFILIVGFAGNGIPAFLFAFAQTGIPSATAGILNSLTPVFTLTIGALVFAQPFHKINAVGVLLGLIGAISLIALRTNGEIEFNLTYGGWIILATVLYAISVNTLRYKLSHISPIPIACLALSSVGVPALFYIIGFTDFMDRVGRPEAQHALMFVLTLAIIGTAFSLFLFNKLVQIAGALPASTVTYLIPVFALGWGILDGEEIGWIHAVGIAIILTGIWLVNFKPQRLAKSQSSDKPIYEEVA
jgi:drug/metabolite transporter (DMT)-like permease